MNKNISLLLFIIITASCNKQTEQDYDYKKIILLATNEEKEAFLLKVFQDDQELRNLTPSVLSENDFDTKAPAYLKHQKEITQRDEINFRKVKHYLETHGYPDFDFEDELAAYAITAVGMHQPYNNQLELLPHFKKAYSENHLRGKNFSSFLNKMHIINFGESFPVINPESLYIEELLNKIEATAKY